MNTEVISDQTPPPRDLKVSDPAVRDKTLLGLSLAPSSILMFRFLDEALGLDSKDQIFVIF